MHPHISLPSRNVGESLVVDAWFSLSLCVTSFRLTTINSVLFVGAEELTLLSPAST